MIVTSTSTTGLRLGSVQPGLILSVLVARGRAQVGVAAATTDWPKRIRDMRYADHEDHGVAD